MPNKNLIKYFRNSFLVLASILALLSFAGCSEKVQSHYPTRADAETAQLFDRGWLPVIIPPSSRNIKVENDLDLNTSAGEFHFKTNDSFSFLSHLHKLTISD